MTAEIDYCGDSFAVDRDPFTIGRDADLVLDDANRHLHRQFLTLTAQHGVWLLSNIGDRLTATASDVDSRLEAFLAPGGVLPLVFELTRVRFTAGPTTYEFTITIPEPAFAAGVVDSFESDPERPAQQPDNGHTTIGRVSMTPDQLRLILALAEPALRGDGRSSTVLPSNQQAARRLGWPITRFNRKLDNVCQKLAGRGVRGLHGTPGNLASSRRGRLVEYALAVRMVTVDDLGLLDDPVARVDADADADDD